MSGDRPWFIVAARFHELIVGRLVEGALDALGERGVDAGRVRVIRVAGAFEVPQAVAAVARGEHAGRPEGVIALAAVVRGETPHFDYVCAETTRGLMSLALETGIPIGFGILTCDTVEQALARARGGHGDKGREAAEAALDLARVLADLRPTGVS